MEAPEKIYLFENPIDGTPDYRWLSKRSDEKDIEYIRKNAFIEKVCEWLKIHHYEYSDWNVDDCELQFETEKMVEDFKKYIKDE